MVDERRAAPLALSESPLPPGGRGLGDGGLLLGVSSPPIYRITFSNLNTPVTNPGQSFTI